MSNPYKDRCVAEYPLNPDTGELEGKFRYGVRDILGLDPFTRDAAIFDELRRLKAVEDAATTLAAEVKALARELNVPTS